MEEWVLQMAPREERKKRGVMDLQQCPWFKFEKSKMPMISVLCQVKCVQLSFLIPKKSDISIFGS